METLLPVVTALAALGLMAASAVWVNRRFGFTVTPPPPPPRTEEEKKWARELGELKLCLRHPYC